VSAALPRLTPLPEGYGATCNSLHLLAAHVLAPARKAAAGRIGLRPSPGGLGTPVFGDDEELRVGPGPDGGALLVCRRGDKEDSVEITSLEAAAAFAGVQLSADPGIGHDPPPLGDTTAPLAISGAALEAAGRWLAFSASVLATYKSELDAAGSACSEIQLWPEHFDLGCNIEGVNFGCSPGDGFLAEPYVYVGPWSTDGLPDGDFWNAPFGAALPYGDLLVAEDQAGTALAFLRRGAALALERAGGS
jgi:hypothetical protein